MLMIGLIPIGTITVKANSTPYFYWPVDTSIDLSTGFGVYEGHKGMDFSCGKGTSVYAAASGTVTVYDYGCTGSHRISDSRYACSKGKNCSAYNNSSSLGSYGGWANHIVIDHGNGYYTRYAHMLSGSWAVKTGDYVEAGKLIGKTSNTGNTAGTTGYHLHFEVGSTANRSTRYDAYGKGWLHRESAANTSAPTVVDLSINNIHNKIGQEFVFTLSSDAVCEYYLSICDSDSGEYIIQGEKVAEVYKNAFLRAGHYVAWMTAANSKGNKDSNFVDFWVFGDPPTTASFATNKTELQLGETVTLTTSTNAYYVRIAIALFLYNDSNNGTKVCEGDVPYSYKFTPSANGVYKGYVTAWTHEGAVDSNWVTFYVGKYSIKYDANSGAGAPPPQTKTHGVALNLSSTKPTRPGYTFLGWSTSSTATSATYQPGGNFTSNGNTTLYAVWKKGCESNAHRYVNTVTAPTCTAQGYTTHTCSLCGYSYKDTYVNATGHSYSYKATKAPTTLTTGTLAGTCSKCSGTTTVTLPKLTATDYSYAVTKAATCTANGTGRYTWKTTTYGSFYFDETIYTKGHNYGQNVTAPTCTAQGYTTHTCSLCGNSYKDTYTNATGHSYVDGICSSCGEKDPDYQPMIQWAGSNVTLGGALALNFAFDTAQLDGTTGNYIVLTRSYADGREDDVVTIPQNEWISAGGTYIQVSYTNMAAKEMGDKITAVIYNAAGKAISETRTDSMAEYSMRMLVRADIVASAEKRTLFVDMLNYGAAAQVYFDYDAENLVNATLTEEQAGWASAAVKIDNYRQSSGCYLGSSLSLEEEIYLKVAFGVVCEEGMYATVSFTDHYGTQVEKQVPIEADGSYTIVRVEGMAIADYRGLVTCKLYSASGAELGSTIDSIESYASRMASALQKNGVDLGDAIMKLGASSYAFFH